MTRCKCQEGEINKRQWMNRGINPEKTDKTFGNFKVWNDTSMTAKNTATSYYKKFDDIRDSKQNSIIFCGQVGSGKTHLSIALALNFIKKGTNVIYMPYRDVVTALKQNMIDYEYYKREISKYQLAEILLIDDLFKGKVTESDVNIMFEIINYRYLNNLPIIVSTEFIIERMLNFDEGVGSRIYEMCKYFIVQIEGKENNYRLKA
ncbi:ATPase AAA [Clostridium novyi B str. ATCC 27606]|uniref:ATPase AAA n=2 Tax=Clostridium novyi TaxID=1542 RepID=A0AA40IU05_CLONO|nr:ATPase AAA [Clostridium novyi B str. ATCC 27606]